MSSRPESSIHGRFEAQVDRTPDAVALVYGDNQVTYKAFNAYANQMAWYLHGQGIGLGDRVALCLQRSLNMVIGLISTLKIGAAYVALGSESPKERQTYILNEVHAQCLLAQGSELDQFQDVSSRIISFDHVRKELQKQPTHNLAVDITSKSFAYIVYTSGSTGRPKGVLGHHRGVLNYYEYLRETYDLREDDVVLQIAPFTFDASLRDLIAPLTVGARVILTDQKHVQDPATLLQNIHDHRITCLLSIVPSRLHTVLDAISEKNATFDSVRLVLVSGEAFYRSVAQRARSVFGDHVSLVNQYGPTECTMTSTYYRVTEKASQQEIISIGSPIVRSQIHRLGLGAKPVPHKAAGEVYLSGPGLTWGYVGHPDLTADKFRPNHCGSALPGSRLYKTGDLAKYEDDGCLYFSGRMDRQIKVNGVRIELGEVESVLMRCDAINHCALVVRNSRKSLVAYEQRATGAEKSQTHMRLVAYVVCREEISDTDLRRFLQSYLPSYMLPHVYIRVDELPLNTNGKVNVNALPEPESVRPHLGHSFVPARTETEIRIAEILKEVLGLDRVGVYDDFFDLGGDSLMAMQTVNRLRQIMNADISVRELFEYRTVANLAPSIQRMEQHLSVLRPAVIERAPQARYPLSFAEQGIWFLSKLEPENPYYIARGIIELGGSLNLKVFTRSWKALLKRHDMLRVRFGEENGVPWQMFDDLSSQDLPLTDLTHLSRHEGMAAIRLIAEEEGCRPFNLALESPVRLRLFRLSSHEHALLLMMHEIMIDIWSIRVALRDLSSLYKMFINGTSSPLTPLKLNFRDFVLREQEHFTRSALTGQETYWKNELSGELPILNLPFDRPRGRTEEGKGKSAHVLLDSNLTHDVKALAKKEKVTLFVTLLTAFDLLLHAYTGQDDLVVGTPLANRHEEEMEKVIGFCLNMLPLRSTLTGNVVFTTLLQRVDDTVTGALANADYPFMWMLDLADTPRESQVTPIFQVMFNMLSYTDLHCEAGGVTFGYTILPTRAPKYDLALYAQESGDQIFLKFSYSSTLFNDETIERMLEAYTLLLKQIVAYPNQPVSKLTVMSKADEQVVLGDWNKTAGHDYEDAGLQALFERQVKLTPDRIALVHNDQQMTYTTLNARANRLAHLLRRQGVGAETVVALCLERSCDMMVAILGVLKSGGAYVALDPQYPLLRLQDILTDVEPTILLVEKALDRFDEYSGTKIIVDNNWSVIHGEDSFDPPCITTASNLLNVVYTSASTGKPKGTMITIGAVLNRLHWMWDVHPFQPNDVAVLQKSYALVAVTWECFGGLLSGIPTVILSNWDVLDRTQLWTKLTQHDVSFLLASPALLEGVIEQQIATGKRWNTLRLATSGAEPITPSLVHRWGQVFPHVPLYNLYGSTECSSNVTTYDTRLMTSESVRVPVGVPLPNIRVFVLDRCLRMCPIGVVGELYVAGRCLARGYVKLPMLTARHFIPNPYSHQADSRLLKTGDLARFRSDGALEVVGRQDHQVKLRGFRLDLADIESVLSQHDQVKHCAVSVFEKDVANKQLVAYVMLDGPLSPSHLRTYLQDRLPEYMVPTSFVELAALPCTLNGKLNRQALPPPTSDRGALDTAYIAPRTPLEETITAIWREVLDRENIGIHDNFFALGGHSLLATRAVSLMSKALTVNLMLRDFFAMPTVADLAEGIEAVHWNAQKTSRVGERSSRKRQRGRL